ncbi:Acyl-CoA synthetase (AMP-forming)/AMP-acid ligase II [Thermomonospora echinospora]|uniref:Acyl-CoA synthetase (AMP-forming)/AMP-acid ligase II n=1 Tax=Thermomonospora echinospora TaxID=1992 RepID=A0A1H6DWN1_9ACTN|nr:AMP-binding protein [Thermomonospora echinospora]SEG89133.1 Acyl-CoA synthetase (AMP-forming)/AMP-acid ligase II [Thermomonospora echinospora]
MKLWVVVPAYNEGAGITATLEALSAQRRAPEGVIVVDNASTDDTADVVRAYAAAHPELNLELLHESQKGTGSAADTGMRHAIARGATHLARTDADCLPPPHWTTAIVRAFDDGLQMVAGGLRPRTDEFPLTWKERRLLPLLQELAALFGRFRPANRDPDYLGPYVMSPACTLAITAELYERSGGFPRAPIEEVHDDRELVNRVRKVTTAYGRRRDVWVYWSMRRARAYGLRGTLSWYADHGHRPEVVDVRLPVRRPRRPPADPPKAPRVIDDADLVGRVLAQAERTPGAVALVHGPGDRRMTYGELRHRVLAVTHGLRRAGLRPGDGVLVGVRHSAETVIIALSVVAAGGTLVICDPGAGPQMFAARLRAARPRWVIAESALYSLNRLGVLRGVARRAGLLLPGVTDLRMRHVHVGPRLPGVPAGALDFAALMRGPAPEPDGERDPGAPAVVVFTSGTTSRPRGVVHSAASLAAGLELCRERFPLGPGDVVHDAGFMLGLPALLAGARWSIPSGRDPVDGFLPEVARRGVTHAFCVPVHLARMLEETDRLPRSLRYLLLGSAPVPPAVLRRAVAAAGERTEVLSVYAMTEMLPVSIADAHEKFAHWSGGAGGDLLGAPLPGVAARIADDGELLLRGPNTCLGYLGDPPLEWLETGDLARLDQRGRLVMVGRKKDMLIRGSVNIYPGLYEPAIAALPGVAEAAMVGLPDPVTRDEEVVVAVLPDGSVPPDALPARLRRELPEVIDAGALPDRIVVLPGFPRAGRSHKLDRAALRALVGRQRALAE